MVQPYISSNMVTASKHTVYMHKPISTPTCIYFYRLIYFRWFEFRFQLAPKVSLKLHLSFHEEFFLLTSIIIIIISRHQHGYPWPSLATPPYRTLLPAGLQGYIPYRHIAAVCRFVLVFLPLLVHVKESTGVRHLWACPYFSSSVPHVWFV